MTNPKDIRYWKNVLRSLESATSSLELFEGVPLVDESIAAISKLITLGQTLEEVQSYGSDEAQKATFNSFQTIQNLPSTPLPQVKDPDSVKKEGK